MCLNVTWSLKWLISKPNFEKHRCRSHIKVVPVRCKDGEIPVFPEVLTRVKAGLGLLNPLNKFPTVFFLCERRWRHFSSWDWLLAKTHRFQLLPSVPKRWLRENPPGLVKKSQGVRGRDLAMPASASRQPAASSCFLTSPFLWSQRVHRPPGTELWCQFPSRVETKCISLALRSPSAKVVRSVLRSPLPCQGPSSESYHLHPWTFLDLHPHPTAGNTSRVSHLIYHSRCNRKKSLLLHPSRWNGCMPSIPDSRLLFSLWGRHVPSYGTMSHLRTYLSRKTLSHLMIMTVCASCA